MAILKQNPWVKTQQAYLLQTELVNAHGFTMAEMPGITSSVFAYVSADTDATITSMQHQISFRNTSLSTLKRAVIWLLDNKLIYQTTGYDKRVRLLKAVEV